jgi:hypothetical protein
VVDFLYYLLDVLFHVILTNFIRETSGLLFVNVFVNPKQIFPEETLTTTLETGQLDAIAAYKHEAIAKGLPYIALPSQINLGVPNHSDFYN